MLRGEGVAMKQVVFWGFLLAALPAWAASPDSTAVTTTLDVGPTAAQSMEIGDQRMKQGNYLGAAFQYQRAVEKDPSNIDAYLKLGSAYTRMGLSYQVYFTKAESTYAHVASMKGKQDARYRKGIADLALAEWNVDNAISIYQKLTVDFPDSCSYMVMLADAQRLKGLGVQETEGRDAALAELDEAEKSARKAMALCPDRIEPVQMLAAIMDSRKSYQDVVALYESMLKKSPGKVDYLRGYAIATYNARDWENAGKALSQLLEKDPRFEERMMYIAVLRKLNRLDEAEAQKRIALKEQPVLQGPVQLTQEDILKEKIGLQKDVEQFVKLVEDKKCDESITLLKGTRTRIEGYLQDPEFKDAASDLLVWLDSRILYAQGACK
jgi:tetratricopeptide (TPR) repeat protein